ncbi:jg25750 [Pararge aegeria aegeria]|uniref:Jg25750 protein n=1 Tax=Pararge aegeria aegeria TaxID=348720 RepID=A0A8S4QLP3_9NEOP|nr:jg25750 [Pararge aegeria aegeria]
MTFLDFLLPGRLDWPAEENVDQFRRVRASAVLRRVGHPRPRAGICVQFGRPCEIEFLYRLSALRNRPDPCSRALMQPD